MRLPVKNMNGADVRSLNVKDHVFSASKNVSLVHQVLVGELANARQGTASTKTRAEVSGGGRKPWRQKGTGRARAGSNRSPIWRGGGVTFGPKMRSYRKNTPRRMKRLALISAISSKISDGDVLVVDSLKFDEPTTTNKVESNLKQLGLFKSTLLLGSPDHLLNVQYFRNIPWVKAIPVEILSVGILMKYQKILIDVQGIKTLERMLENVRRKKTVAVDISGKEVA
mgnify:CR=1 FL=1|tara:strand:+ start:46 stop:723 length:678 start_codon:yes stop_codon:yes gene_type:complete